MRFHRLLHPSLVAVLAALVLTAATSPAEDTRRHTRLVKSVPAKDSVLTSVPASLQLWFNERIELGVTRVRLTNTDGGAIALGPLTRADSADAPIMTTVMGDIPDGAYTVSWSTSSKDGHVVRGTFGFAVKAGSGR